MPTILNATPVSGSTNLLDLNRLKTHLNISLSDSSQDTFLAQLLDDVWETVQGWCNRKFASQTYTEYYDGTGRQELLLRKRPLTAIDGVWMDQIGFYGQGPGGFDPVQTLLQPGTDYFAENFEQNETNPSKLVMITNPWAFGVLSVGEPIGGPRSVWYLGRGNVKVTYTAGYTTCPNDLELACFQLCAMVKNSRPIGDFKGSVTMGKTAYQIVTNEQSQEVGRIRSILGRYTECAI